MLLMVELKMLKVIRVLAATKHLVIAFLLDFRIAMRRLLLFYLFVLLLVLFRLHNLFLYNQAV